MNKLITAVACALLFSGCSEHFANRSTANNPAASSSPISLATGTPIVQPSGLVLRCVKCTFIEERGELYIAGQIKNDAKLPVTSYVMAVDLLDQNSKSVKKFPGLMLMSALPAPAGDIKEFKERVLSDDKGITQAVVYLKKAGTEEKLSESLTLKLNRAPAPPK